MRIRKQNVTLQEENEQDNMSTTTLQSVWKMLLSYDLTAANKRWLAEHLYEQALEEEKTQPYTLQELNARIDQAETDIAAGRTLSREEASERMKSYINQYHP